MFPKRRFFKSYIASNPVVVPLNLIVPVEVRKYNSMTVHEFVGTHTGERVLGHADDVYLLLMQKNYDKINNLEYQSFLKDFSLSASTVKSVNKPKMSDNQLISYIKSRHIQSASELQSWMSYLCGKYDIEKSKYENELSEVKSLVEEHKSKLTPPVSSLDSSSSSSD